MTSVKDSYRIGFIATYSDFRFVSGDKRNFSIRLRQMKKRFCLRFYQVNSKSRLVTGSIQLPSGTHYGTDVQRTYT